MSLHSALHFIRHFLLAVDRHSLQGSFAFRLFEQTQGKPLPAQPAIEQIRKQLLQDPTLISFHDLGAKSGHRTTSIQKIAQSSLSSFRMSVFFRRLLDWRKAKTVLELGTSLGINAAYLAQNADRQLYTFEGIPEIGQIAQKNWEKLQIHNIQLIPGNIDESLPQWLTEKQAKIDIAFIDANHTYAATMRYFEQLLPFLHEDSLLIFDDLYYSKAMTQAWEEIKAHPKVHCAFDYYRFGILSFSPRQNPKSYRMEFRWW
ncbi:class I SAM-dependent methyltransferase [Persicobacter diffluens]|uniref:O-methyltransferase n=1 Tax=Persicobacter diffluens TaxID=981 RepID=A0AAN4VWV5_9BACT|nr:O-methyltransferase [Persicobacter diffluens]